MIKKALIKTAEVISSLGYTKVTAANHEVLELELKTRAIDPKTLTLNQRNAVKAAFEQTSNLFEKLK